MGKISVNTTDSTALVVVMGVLLFAVGIGMTAYGVGEYRSYEDALDDAAEVEATIVESSVQPYSPGVSDGRSSDRNRDDEDREYRLVVEFEYEFEGQQYRSSNFDLAGTTREYDSRSKAQRERENYLEGDQVTAYVRPDEPGEAFLEGGMPWVVYGILGFGALLIVGPFVMFGAHFARTR